MCATDRPRVVSIVGPTASGKTGLGIAIARALAERGERAEIVNADAYQMYRGMDIGTAKPSPEELAAVPHHLIDIVDPDDAMSVARFQTLARDCIADLQSRGIRPILVGGSGLYARAAIDDISSRYYLRFMVKDCPGVLASITQILADRGISISSLIQHERYGADGAVPLVILTHKANEREVRNALGEIDTLSINQSPVKLMRIEDI